MDRTGTSRTERATAMRVAGPEPIEFLLRACGRVVGECRADAGGGPTVSGDAVLRQPEDGRGIRRESQAGAAADASDGPGGDLPEAAAVATQRRASDLPLFAAGFAGNSAQPGVVQRHHLRADAAGVTG